MNNIDKREKANLILLKFYQDIDDIFVGYFVVLTAPQVWRPHLDKYIEERQQLLKEIGVRAEDAVRRVDEAGHIFGEGKFRVQTDTARLRKLLVPGAFENLQAKNAIKLIYDGWENGCRKKLKELLGEEVKGDIWGDLGKLRDSITHHDSIAIDRVKGNKIIKDFKPGQEIVVTHDIMARIQQEIENWYYTFFQKYVPVSQRRKND